MRCSLQFWCLGFVFFLLLEAALVGDNLVFESVYPVQLCHVVSISNVCCILFIDDTGLVDGNKRGINTKLKIKRDTRVEGHKSRTKV